jgi:HAD superfamily hydrolase (TIGR01509 family)
MDNRQGEAGGAARAVLWDVDGTLIDSAEYHWLTWRETLLGEGYELTRAQFDSSFGQRNDEILRGYFGENLSAGEVARIGEAKEDRYRELVGTRGIEPLPGVRRWLGKLKTEGWRQAIASSAPRLNLEAILKALGLENFFAAVASAEDVSRGKPDPQIFLVAAAKVSVAPSRCVVVEDAPAGTEAARRAGMRRVGVLSSHGALEADVVVSSLAELPDDTFDRLLLRR